MTSLRSTVVYVVLSVLCCVLLLSSSANSQMPTSCTRILGDANLTDYSSTLELGQGNLIVAIGYFRAPLFTVYANYTFTFTVPDQTGFSTPNELKFAVYTNATNESPQLVAQSQTVTIQSVSGPQTFSVALQGGAYFLIPGRAYLLAVWNQYDTTYYYNSNARQGDLAQSTVDASVTFPNPLAYEFQFNNYLFPVGYDGCMCNTLLGDDTVADYPNTLELGQGNLIVAIGSLQAPLLTLYTSFEFTFTIPDQTGFSTPNELKFAVYTNNITSPALVAQSQTVTIQSVSGPQSFTVALQGSSHFLLPGHSYVLAVWNQYDTTYYYNTNGVQGDLAVSTVDASVTFPNPLPVEFQFTNYLFPLAFRGCDIAL